MEVLIYLKMLFSILLLVLVGLITLYILSLERFKVKPVGARFPGTSYLTFKKVLTNDASFNLEVTFQTLDTIGGVLYAEKYFTAPGGWVYEPNSGPVLFGDYYLCVEYTQLVFYVIQINPQTNTKTSTERLVLENKLARGLTHKVTLQANGNTLYYEERGISYPLKSFVTTGENYYVGGPSLTLTKLVIPAFKGCIYSLKGPNGYVNFPVDHQDIKVGPC